MIPIMWNNLNKQICGDRKWIRGHQELGKATRGRNGELLFNGYGVSIQGDADITEIGSGVGCAALWM